MRLFVAPTRLHHGNRSASGLSRRSTTLGAIVGSCFWMSVEERVARLEAMLVERTQWAPTVRC